ncbi:MAG: efflux transporter outer membrane subunit [Deltaproteobacteria bacterium]|jgi:NodT family efflux transporter outer membrane factor (OMF) lipoprotein|nr:efflux transporter outer membrane subunit [Deltaproteobacteria bacterium]
MTIAQLAIRRFICLFCLAATAFLSAGCEVGPDFVRPAPPPVTRYTNKKPPEKTITALGWAQHFEMGQEIAPGWWRVFQCGALDGVVREAIVQSPNLQSALARLKQSREDLMAGYGVFFPQVNGGFGAERQKFSPLMFGSTVTAPVFDLYTLEGTVSYTLDVFGGERRQVEGLAAQVEYQKQTARAAYLTLVGNVVNAVIAAAAYRAEIKATRQIIALQQNQLKITESQAEGGTAPYSNVLAIKTQLEATRATLPPLEKNLSQSEHLLTALLGKTPEQWTPPQIDLDDLTLPVKVPVTLPSELVHRRPDILAAEAQLHSASANIGVATAAMFPNITLSGTYGQNNTAITGLFAPTGNFWSMAANAAAPIFHGGTLWFNRRAAIQAYKVSFADYRQAVTAGFQQVADSLRALQFDANTLEAQTESLAAASQNLKLVESNYEAGLAGYLDVLTADNQYQQAKIAVIEARALRLQDTSALFTALGGGMEGRQRQK